MRFMKWLLGSTDTDTNEIDKVAEAKESLSVILKGNWSEELTDMIEDDAPQYIIDTEVMRLSTENS